MVMQFAQFIEPGSGATDSGPIKNEMMTNVLYLSVISESTPDLTVQVLTEEDTANGTWFVRPVVKTDGTIGTAITEGGLYLIPTGGAHYVKVESTQADSTLLVFGEFINDKVFIHCEGGEDGQDGEDGTTFTPSVSSAGVLSWTNDGGKTNPSPVDIVAAVEENTIETVSGTTPAITAVAGHSYECGEVQTLSFTPSAEGICDVIFTSGSTATVLTVPNTVKWPGWFDPTSLSANTIYELNVSQGVYGAVMAWQA